MSNDNVSNAALLGQLILQGLQNLQQYQQLVNAARVRGTDVTDEELDALGDEGRAIREAARAEADRQRADG